MTSVYWTNLVNTCSCGFVHVHFSLAVHPDDVKFLKCFFFSRKKKFPPYEKTAGDDSGSENTKYNIVQKKGNGLRIKEL